MKMLINDIENKDELFNVIVSELRNHGIKYRKEKRPKNGQDKTKCRRIFNMPLHVLELTDVILANGGIAQVPLFVSDACQRILEQVNTEGLFRKAGSSKRQQEIKASLESGAPLGKAHHVIDVANILKTFFRDLPEPLLPTGNMQEALLRCLLSGEKKIFNLTITCLLLPPLTLNTLAFFMQFLHTVSLHSNCNKMSVENLAIILTPNVMPIAEMIQQRLNSHVKVVQYLIENSHQIGVVPQFLLGKLSESLNFLKQSTVVNTTSVPNTDKKKKKRRSGSLTRMFNGLRKIVGAIGSSESLDKTTPDVLMEVATPCLSKSAKKRKVTDGIPFSAKKKKDIVSLLPDNRDLLPCTPIAAIKEPKKCRLSLGGGRKHAKTARLAPSSSVASIIDNKPMERRWSVVGAPWARKKQHRNKDEEKSVSNLSPVLSLPCLKTPEINDEDIMLAMPLTAKPLFQEDNEEHDSEIMEDNKTEADYVKISKSEYEAIKDRVSAIETRISQEFGNVLMTSSENGFDCVERVQDKYEKTLEETEPIEATCSTTDQLAKRLSRELKIRRSAEHKIIRSPSARKIGTIRRRSRENIRLSRNQSWHLGGTANLNSILNKKPIAVPAPDLSFYPKSNLKRGRPNTLQSGLRHPDLSPTKKSLAEESSSDLSENWTCANSFFSHTEHNEKNISIDVADNASTTPMKTNNEPEQKFKTPEVPYSRRSSLRSNVTPPFVTRIEIGESKTPMLPPNLPPRKTPAKPSLINKALLTPLQDLQTGRASIARLRCQNAGMVMAKAKLFDGMVSDGSSSNSANRRQSSRFVVRKNPNEPKVNSEKLTLKTIEKIRSNSASSKSPRRSTPRKKHNTKSPRGGVNRRNQLRLAKSPANAFKSPRINKILQDKQVDNIDVSTYFSPKIYDLTDLNRTPHIKKQLMQNSPRRLMKTPGRENQVMRQQTPLKATPLPSLSLGYGDNGEGDVFNSRRQSPRLAVPKKSTTLMMRP